MIKKRFISKIMRKFTKLNESKACNVQKNESLISFWTKTESSNKWSCSNLMIKGSKIIIDGAMVNIKPRNTSLKNGKKEHQIYKRYLMT